MSTPLWQVLLTLTSNGLAGLLTCEECFTFLEFVLELASTNVANPDDIRLENLAQAIRKHEQHCPHCQEHHQQRLQEWEAMVARLNKSDELSP